MGRIIGLIGCTCLVIVALRLTNLHHSDHTLKGSEDRAQVTRMTPRQHFKLGKEMFLRGKYRDAVQHLDAATTAVAGLTGTERKLAEDYRDRARMRLADSATVRGQSEPAWESDGQAPAQPAAALPPHLMDATRNRVEKLMTQAQGALKRGDKAEARQLATLANQLSKDAGLKFPRTEASPAGFLAGLQGPAPAGQGQVTTAALPDWAADDATTGTAQPRRAIQQISAESPTAAPAQRAPSSAALSSQEQAARLVAQSRQDYKAGRYEEARQKALAADELDATFGVFDDRPELLLADIDRATQTTTYANATQKRKTPAADAAPKAETDDRRKQAVKLLAQAREDLANGNLEAAQAKAEQAEKMNVAFGLFEDMPEVVMNDIAARRAAEGIAETKSPAAAPAAATSPASKTQALALMKKARQALEEERFDEARQLALEAERLKAPYNLFDDRPDIVLADVARAARRGPNTPGNPIDSAKPAATPEVAAAQPVATQPEATQPDPAFEAAPATQNVNTAVARQSLSPAQAQAIDLLRQSRQLMKAGRFDEARAKAEEAEQMNVTFPVFADRPDLVLADLNDQLNNANVASRQTRQPVQTASGVQAGESFAADLEPTDVPQRGSITQADSISEFSPSGESASELYGRGVAELNRGNRQAAYSHFLAAHQTGQKLDTVRAQRMQEWLRELAPRGARSGIQLANNQVSAVDDAANTEEPQPAPLDAAQQEQMVRYDRLRSDVLNSVFKAERLKATDPEGALTLIDQTMARVEGADLSEESAAALMKQLNKTRSGLQAEIVRQQPNLDLKHRNQEVQTALENKVKTDIRIEQEYAKLVDEFNELFKQGRRAEAEIVAKKAMEMNPKDPTATAMFWKARIGARVASNEQLKLDKEESWWKQLDDVEKSVIVPVTDANPLHFGEDYADIKKRRDGRYRTDNRKRGEAELKIEQSLQKRISLHEDKVPLGEVINKIRAIADINIVLDSQGLEEEAASSNSLVSIDVDGIQVKSALNLILSPNNLAYMIDNEVLKITSRMRQQGELIVTTYSVADLVVPIPDPSSQTADPFGALNAGGAIGGGQMSIPATGQGFGQVAPNQAGIFEPSTGRRQQGQNLDPDFSALTELITSTIAPDSWDAVGGPASVRIHPTTLSLVIRQTQKVHEEITDLLEQLRRLQDLQVTIEVRFVTVSDRFFERIGIDFNFNMLPTTGLPTTDNNGLPLQTFGSVNLPQFGLGGTQNQQGQNQQGQNQQGVAQQGQAQAQAGFFGAGPRLNLYNNPASTSIVGMSNTSTFTRDLTVPFQQGSFEVGVPTFGSYNPQAGMEMGLAILSDIEAFFFIQAAQGDQRNNLMFAPKVTVFNGQTGFVQDAKSRPFVVSLIPTVGFASTGFQPVIQQVQEGITLSVTAVVSSDRRYVRLSVNPQFNSITDVFTFSFIGGSQQGQQQQGQNQQGGQGAFGGNQFGQGQGQQGFGIGGGVGNQNGNNQGGNNQNGNNNGGQTVTVQQPVVETVQVLTTVSVPDGGTILLGGVKRLKEGRNMAGVPILNKIPYVSRLFKNTGVGRETESLMLMITPRIIIQEEEEELLGLPRTN